MIFKQTWTYDEQGFGVFDAELWVAETLEELQNKEMPYIVHCINIKSLKKAFANNETVENSILTIELDEANCRTWWEWSLVEVLKREPWVQIVVGGQEFFLGQISEEYDGEDFLHEDKIFRVWSFQTKPVSEGLLKEVKLQDVIDRFSESDWYSLCGEPENFYLRPCYVESTVGRVYTTWYGTRDVKYENWWTGYWLLISLNWFLGKLIEKYKEYVLEEYGLNVDIEIEEFEMPYTFLGGFPKPLFGYRYFGTYTSGETEVWTDVWKKIKIRASESEDWDGIFIHAFHFKNARNFPASFVDNKEHQYWSSDIMDLEGFDDWVDRFNQQSILDFVFGIAQNFGLNCSVTGSQGQYVIRFSSVIQEGGIEFEPKNIIRGRKTIKTSEEQEFDFAFTNHYFWVEDDKTLETKLGVIKHYDGVFYYDVVPWAKEINAKETKEIFWGLYPFTYFRVRLRLGNGDEGVDLLVNGQGGKYEGTSKYLDEGWSQKQLCFTREIYIGITEEEAEGGKEPTLEPDPKDRLSIPRPCFYKVALIGAVVDGVPRFWYRLSDLANEIKGVVYTTKKEYEIELSGFHSNAQKDFRLFSPGNYFLLDGERFRIIEVEFDFSNLVVKAKGVNYVT